MFKILLYLRKLNKVKLTALFLITITLTRLFAGAIISFIGISHPTPEPLDSAYLIFTAVIIGPFAETYLGQILPIYLIEKVFKTKKNFLKIMGSAFFFVIFHKGDIATLVTIFIAGMYLALFYLILRIKSKIEAFWMTALLHSLLNVLAIITYYVLIYFNI